MMEGLGADSEEKRESASDIDTAEVDSLKVLDPEWPIREVLDPEWPIREADISLCANRYRIGARCLSLNSCSGMDRNRG
jgi:hypothetical protein